MNKLKQTTTLTQKKVLSQQTRQAIRLLQLNSYDLEKEVDNLILDNPLLEKNEEVESNYDVGSSVNTFNTDADDILKYHRKTESLQESLNRQLDMTSLTVNEKIIASILIDCVNENGYLTEDLKDIFIQANREIEASFQEIFYVLHTLQRFEPIGTCALDLCDSLSIQLDHSFKESPLYQQASDIIQYLKTIDSSDSSKLNNILSELNKNTHFDNNALELIRKLNPKPGLEISKRLDSYHISPEIIIFKRDGKWVTELTKNKPLLKLNAEYVSLMKETKIKTDINYLRKNYNEAKFIIKSIKNRNLTILNVCREIFTRQIDFLNDGDIGMKPMTLKDVAESLGIHESTVSRATSNKFVQTPRGVYELKYFFSSELFTDTGTMISSKVIMKMIEECIKEENTNKPLSDNEISKFFTTKGVSVARRTITKYREKINIPNSTQRKRNTYD
ncbi:MAG: RNA polymerase factor sigma-54 [Pseudomonadota bacterium]|nr:RNA polymerase factor sigma-54 [Pseudomonadota bacterium]